MTLSIPIRDGLELLHVGPSLDLGPLPSIFYLALSAQDSLTKDPFNQPVQSLSDQPIRFFSLDLPAHEKGRSPQDALSAWAQDIANGIDIFTPFFERVVEAVHYGIANHWIDAEKLGIAGLSRGGFMASHIAVLEPKFKAVLQFAPLTTLNASKDLLSIADHPLSEKYNLTHQVEKLANRQLRFYIGNKDTRVSTKACMDFASLLIEKSTLRSPQVELILTPSIGQMGHGTSPQIFSQGAQWLAAALQ